MFGVFEENGYLCVHITTHMISEGQLKNLLKHYLVLEYKNRGTDAMCIREYLPLCAALLYPYIGEDILEDKTSKETILPIIDSVKRHANITLNIYSLEGLRRYFENTWLNTIRPETQKQFLRGVSLITSIEEGGYFSINGNEKVHDCYLSGRVTYPDVSGNYGEQEYIMEQQTANENAVVSQGEETESSGLPRLDNLREFLLTNFPHNSYPTGLYSYRYLWQYKITGTQYSDLKRILKELDLGKNINLLGAEPYGTGLGTVALCVILYVAEWYKRECTSLDGDGCLETIGLGSGNTKVLWKKSGLTDELLHHEGGNQLRQMAMCVLGGFPLCFVSESIRFRDFVNKVAEIESGATISDETIEEIVDCFDQNNRVFSKSLQEGSCREYLESLLQYLVEEDNSCLPFNICELNDKPYVEFLRKLKEGYDDALKKNFFTSYFSVWASNESESLESEFTAQIGYKKSENVVTEKELRKLGVRIPDEVNSFSVKLRISFQDGDVKDSDNSRIFNRIGNGCRDFCGAFGSNITTEIDVFNLKSIDLLFIYEGGESTYRLYDMQSYLELCSTEDNYLWTTKTDNKGNKSLLYDPSIYSVTGREDSSSIRKSDGEKDWIWMSLTGDVTLMDTNQNSIQISIGARETISVDFRMNTLKKDVALTSNGCFCAFVNGEPAGEVPILCYNNDSGGNRTLMMICDGRRGKDIDSVYLIEYKPINNNRYREWSHNEHPDQGFLTLRISCRDSSLRKKPWIGTVYFIPCANPVVKRNLDNNFVYFKGRLCPIKDGENIDFRNNRYQYKDSPDHDKDASTISFRIGNDSDYIIVDVYRAYRMYQIYNNDKIIKTITNVSDIKPPIAVIFEKNMRLRIIDREGFVDKKRLTTQNNYADCFKCPLELLDSEQYDNFSRYFYLQRFDDRGRNTTKVREINIRRDGYDNLIELSVSEKYADQYKFYYWAFNTDKDPQMLNQEHIGKGQYRYMLPARSNSNEYAMVFQSLKECSPNLYFRPFYYRYGTNYENPRTWNAYLGLFTGASIDRIIRTYECAVEHRTYFFMFPTLYALWNRLDNFTLFLREFVRGRNYNITKDDIENLTRLSKELATDWFYINRKDLFRDLSPEEKLAMKCAMEKLLLNSPIVHGERAYSKRFIDRFLSNDAPFGKRNNSLPRKFLCSLDRPSQYIGDSQDRIQLLNELISCPQNIFVDICKILEI